MASLRQECLGRCRNKRSLCLTSMLIHCLSPNIIIMVQKIPFLFLSLVFLLFPMTSRPASPSHEAYTASTSSAKASAGGNGKPKDRCALGRQDNSLIARLWTHIQHDKNSYIIKTGIVGDTNIGKTSLMVKYAEGDFNSEYIQTLGSDWLYSMLFDTSG